MQRTGLSVLMIMGFIAALHYTPQSTRAQSSIQTGVSMKVQMRNTTPTIWNPVIGIVVEPMGSKVSIRAAFHVTAQSSRSVNAVGLLDGFSSTVYYQMVRWRRSSLYSGVDYTYLTDRVEEGDQGSYLGILVGIQGAVAPRLSVFGEVGISRHLEEE